MFGFKRRREYEEYARIVDNSLRVLFADFPEGSLARLRATLEVERIARDMFKDKEISAKQCGVMLARTLLGTLIEGLAAEERRAAAVACDARDLSNPIFYGLAAMDHVARQLVDDMHGRMLLYEAAGKLKGLSRDEIDSWWAQNEVTKITEAVGAREPPSTIGLHGMDTWLVRRRMEEQAAEREEQERLSAIMGQWRRCEPLVSRGIELVNTKLAEYSKMSLLATDPDFFGEDRAGYGIVCMLVGAQTHVNLPVVITEDALYVAGCFHWSEGQRIPIENITLEAVANEIADGVKGMLDE